MNDKTSQESDPSDGFPHKAQPPKPSDEQQTFVFSDASDEQDDSPLVDRSTRDDVDEVNDQTIQFDPDEQSKDDAQATFDAFATEDAISPHEPDQQTVYEPSDDDPQRTTPNIDQTIEFDADAQAERELVSGFTETIVPGASVLESANITQTIDSRTLSEDDRRIWGMTSDPGSQDSSEGAGSPLIDRRAVTESQVAVPQRRLAGLDDHALPTHSDYEIVKVLGEGGMGTVYLAKQTSLDRLIALKMVRPLAAEKAERLRTTGKLEETETNRRNQFLSEAIVTGDLDHPNIVPIHDLALANNNALFYAMKKVDGTPWSKVIMDLSQEENLEILMKVSDAIGFAHARGIIHRDLKPENVMLGEYGVVMLMDWGLAIPKPDFKKKDSIQKNFALGGSPAYMAPEMATGPIESIGPASDIYLLGAILFEIITGRTPHAGNNLTQCLRSAATNQIVEVSSRYDGELMQIARKAMATKPDNRFTNVAEMQMAIRQYRSHAESILMSVRADKDLAQAEVSGEYNDYARAVFGYEEALTLWSHNDVATRGLERAKIAYARTALRNEDFELGLSLLQGERDQYHDLVTELQSGQRERDSRRGRLRVMRHVAAALLVFIMLGGSAALFLINKEKDRAVQARERADANALLAEARRREADASSKLAERKAADEEYQRGIAEREAMEANRQRGIADQKTIEAEQNAEKARQEEKFANEQRIIAEKNKEEAIRQREAAVYESYVAQIGLAKARIDQNEFDDARRILTELKSQSPESEAMGWEWRWLWRQANQFDSDQPLSNAGRHLSIDASGRSAIVTLDDGSLQRIRLDDQGQVVDEEPIKLPDTSPTSVTAISPDQTVIATAGIDAVIRLWNASTMQSLGELKGHTAAITSLAFADQQRLVSGSADRTARVWNLPERRQVAQCWHISAVRDLDCAVFGDRLRVAAAVADDRAGRGVIWDLQDEAFERVGEFVMHEAPLTAVALTRDGSTAASGDRDGRLFVWRTSSIQPIDYARQITLAVKKLSGESIDEDDRTSTPKAAKPSTSQHREFMDRVNDPSMRLMVAGTTSDRPAAHRDAIESIQFSHDGRTLLTASSDFTGAVWDVDSGELSTTLRGHGGWVRDAVFQPGRADRVLSVGDDASVRTWQTTSLKDVAVLQPLKDGAVRREMQPHEDEIWSASFNREGTKIVTASRDHTACIVEIDPQSLSFRNTVDLVDDVERLREGSSFVALSMAIDRRNQRLFIGSADSTVRVWNLLSGGEIDSATGTGLNTTLAVSDDGRLLATGSSRDDARCLVWRVGPQGELSEQPLLRLGEHQTTVTAIAISPDSQQIFTGDRNGVGRLWNVKTGETIGPIFNQHRGFRINAAAFMPDGKQLLIAADDQNVSRMDLATRKPLDIYPHRGFVTRISLSPDGLRLATLAEAAKDGVVKTTATVWDLRTGKDFLVGTGVLRETADANDNADSGQIVNVHAGESGMLVTSHADRQGRVVKLWRIHDRQPQLVRSLQLPAKLASLSDAKLFNGEQLLSLNGDSAFLWDLKNLEHQRSYRAHGEVTDAAFSFDSKYVVTGSRSIRIWDAATGRSLQKIESPHDGAVRSVRFSPIVGDYTFAAGGDDGVCCLWRWDPERRTVEKLKSLQVADQPAFRIHQVRYSPDGQSLLVVGSDAVARLWPADGNEAPLEFTDRSQSSDPAGQTAYLCGAFSSDGKWIAVGCADRQTRIWQLPNADDVPAEKHPFDSPIRVLQGHADRVESIGFLGNDPNHIRLMTASRDKSARVWDPRLSTPDVSGREILALRKHSLGVTAIDAVPDGRMMMTAGRDGKLILWPSE
ncbi:MAG: protein kinase [Pirellulaceae bacterium]